MYFFLHFKIFLKFDCIYLKGCVTQRWSGTEKHSEIFLPFASTLHMAPMAWTGLGRARSQELHPDLPCEWQVPKDLGHRLRQKTE